MLPSFFLAHGAPLLAVQNNEYTDFLRELPRHLPRPRAIVLFSAHWLADEQRIGGADTYETIHDFSGFPDELYDIKYPAKGSMETAAEVLALLEKEGVSCRIDKERGLDHGAWVVLKLLYPQADIPVVAMSVNPRLVPEEHYRIGRALSSLRQKDVLIIGSGGTVHNFRKISWNRKTPDEWALEFDSWLNDHLQQWDLPALFEYEKWAPYATDAVPPQGNEHFIPLLYAMGAAADVKQAWLMYRGYAYGSLSLCCWRFG
ncbi:MAG TPA: class III extradiol ring-cleavage dioxygenase [Bacilli bacterium]